MNVNENEEQCKRAHLHHTITQLCYAFGSEFDVLLDERGQSEYIDKVLTILELFIERDEEFVPAPLNPAIFRATAVEVREYFRHEDYIALRAFLKASIITNLNHDCNIAEVPHVFFDSCVFQGHQAIITTDVEE